MRSLQELVLTPSSNPSVYRPAQHGLALALAGGTFLLLIAGALVTSNDAGLAVPDWPTSFGSLYRIPPMVGGVKYEHGHRMLAEFIGLLTIALALVTWRADTRSWMRKLGFAALGLVIAQGILGGLTVLYYLPWWISSAHATMAQTFFCVAVLMALFTSRAWLSAIPAVTPAENTFAPGNNARSSSLRALTTASVLAVYLQLMLGAAFRHSGIKLLPHLLGAIVVTCILLWTVTRTLTAHGAVPQLRRPAMMLLSLLVLQLALGFAAYLTRVEWGKDAPQPMLAMVISTVAHVATGALVLASTVVLAVQTRRRLRAVTAPATSGADQRFAAAPDMDETANQTAPESVTA